MSKKFKEAACYLTLLSLIVSFKTDTKKIYASSNKKDNKTTSLSNDSKAVSQEIYNEEEGHLYIDWKFDFNNMKPNQIINFEGYHYVVNKDSEAIILGYDKKIDENKIKIPDTLGKYPVTMIYEEAFSGLENTKIIELPQGIKIIGSDSFSYNEKLKEINIPDTVESIDSYAFDGCYELDNIVIPKSVVNLGEGIFFDCTSLKSITISSEIDELRYGFFAGCISLNNPNLPNSIKKISKQVFAGCTSLLEIKIPNEVTSIDDGVFRLCSNLKKITIPSFVTDISENAFEDTSNSLTMCVEKDSYAEDYAKKHKINNKYIEIQVENNIKKSKDDSINQDKEKNVSTGISTVVLNVRSGISTKYKQIGYLEKGMPVDIVEKYSNGWYKIKYKNSYGYVLGAYIKLDQNQNDIPLKGRTKAILNVRNGILTSNKKIGKLSKESYIDIVAKCSNDWYKIKYQDSYGYVSGAYIEFEENVNLIGMVERTLNVRDGASLYNEKIGYLIQEKRVEIVEDLKNGWYKIRYDDAYGYVQKKYIKICKENTEKVIAIGKNMVNLNVRSKPYITESKIGELEIQTRLEIVKELSNGWYKIKYKGWYGYISGAYVELEGNNEITKRGTTTSTLKVRDGASINGKQIGYIEQGKNVHIVKELLNGWYKIKYKDYYGYVSGAYIKLYEIKEVKAIAQTKVVLNVRNGASTSSRKIGYLEKDTKVEIVKELLNGWYKIKYKSDYGYIPGGNIKIITNEYKTTEYGVARKTLNVRNGASTNNVKIGFIKKGEKVEIVKKLSSGWYKIKYKNSYAYISSIYIDL